MKILFLFVVLLGYNTGQAQVHYALHDSLLLEGYRSYKMKDYQKTVYFYQKAFKINETTRISDYLQAAHSASMINDPDLCKKMLSKSVQHLKTEFKTISGFSKDSKYKQSVATVKLDYPQLIQLYYQSIPNPEIYQAIQDLIRKDQFVRKISDYYMGVSEKAQEKAFDDYLKAQETKDTVAMKLNKAIMFPKANENIEDLQEIVRKKVDSLNILDLIEITEIHGWHKEAHILLWHQRGSYGENNWIWNYFVPLINKEIEEGKVKSSFWAAFEDHKSIMENGVTIYGYHPGKVNSKEVNNNRKTIGLPQLTDAEIEHRNNNPYGGRIF